MRVRGGNWWACQGQTVRMEPERRRSPGFTRTLQGESVTDTLLKGKLLPKIWASEKALGGRGGYEIS
jgi:hypothetical protein